MNPNDPCSEPVGRRGRFIHGMDISGDETQFVQGTFVISNDTQLPDIVKQLCSE